MLKIWGRHSAFNVQKVLWFAGELKLPYEHVPAGGEFGALDTPEFLAMNPHGRVPVIDDNGVIVWESHAILRYLAARYGAAAFWSGDAAARTKADRWMDWAQTTLQPDFLMGVFWGYFRTPEHLRDWKSVRESIGRCARHFQSLDRQLTRNTYLAGDNFSLADIPAGTALYRYFELDIDRPSVPMVERWYRQLQGRAAYRQHVMIPFEELRGRLEN